MKVFCQILLIQLFFFGLAACASKVRVLSEPTESEVYVKIADTNERKLIGKTPLELPYQDLQSAAGSARSNEFFQLEVQKKDFEVEKLLVAPVPIGTKESVVQVKLRPAEAIAKASQVLQYLHNAQKFATAKQYERAHIEVDKALEVDKKFPRSLSLKGSIYFLEGKYEDSLRMYEAALAVDNSFTDATNMITKVKAQMEKVKKQ